MLYRIKLIDSSVIFWKQSQCYQLFNQLGKLSAYHDIEYNRFYNKTQKVINCLSDPHDAIHKHQGAVSIRKTVLPGMAIPMLNMEIAIRR